jgi:hypothetical protein
VKRRYPALILSVVAMVGVGLAARNPVSSSVPTFSVTAGGWMPSAPPVAGLTETWFCPGVPATGAEGVGGSVVIANRSDERMVGTVLVLNEKDASRRLELEVDGWSTAVVDLDATLPGAMVGAVVEIDGGGAVVEQVAMDPNGESVAPCANATSDRWYLADGFTVEGSLDQIVLTNPFEQTAVVDVEFATREGFRSSASYQGLTVQPRSIRVLDLGAPGAGAQSEPELAVSVQATRGRIVVGRSQHFTGGGRSGAQVSLATPALREQWWFADGIKQPGVEETFLIYNPTDQDVEVDVVFLGVGVAVEVPPILVPRREVRSFETGPLSGLPEGRHATVFATSTNERSIVVERVITSEVDGVAATSVLPGSPPRQDGYVAQTWHIASAPTEPTADGIIVLNADNSPGTITVSVVGLSGPVPVPSLEDIEIGPASQLTIDLTDPLVLGRELLIEGTNRLFVERAVPTGRGATVGSAWAVPAG